MAKIILVPTPIGNLADITLRAIDSLKNADIIAAEDTRHSRKLLNHYQINKELVRLDAHTILERAPSLLTDYETIAFITDAGTPGISDPGSELIQLALDGKHDIEVLPGATAFVPAVILSGLPTNRFTFEGFLPRKGSQRKKRLELIASSPVTSIFYESPKRLTKTLRELEDVCGQDRLASVSRELSKKFETTYRGSLGELAKRFDGNVKGEVVISVGPRVEEEIVHDNLEALLQGFLDEGLTGKDLRRALMDAGIARNKAYELSVRP